MDFLGIASTFINMFSAKIGDYLKPGDGTLFYFFGGCIWGIIIFRQKKKVEILS